MQQFIKKKTKKQKAKNKTKQNMQHAFKFHLIEAKTYLFL